jgi:hypothetical protein
MLQVFHMDVAKVNRDVAYVAMIIRVCCKCAYLDVAYVFRAYVVSVISGCCIYIQWFQVFLQSVSNACFKFISLKTYVVSVISGCFKSRLCITFSSSPTDAPSRCLLRLQRGPAQPSRSFPFQVLKLGIGQRWRSRGQCWPVDADRPHWLARHDHSRPYVVSVISGCFKSRLCIAFFSSPTDAPSRCLLRLQRGSAQPSRSFPFQVLKLGIGQRWRSRGQCWPVDADRPHWLARHDHSEAFFRERFTRETSRRLPFRLQNGEEAMLRKERALVQFQPNASN